MIYAMSLEEVGKRLGLTPMQVQVAQASALRKLRRKSVMRRLLRAYQERRTNNVGTLSVSEWGE